MSGRATPQHPDPDDFFDGLDFSGQSQPTERLTYRLDELAQALGVSRRTIERERAANRFPKADLCIGRMPLWRVETIRDWVAGGGR